MGCLGLGNETRLIPGSCSGESLCFPGGGGGKNLGKRRILQSECLSLWYKCVWFVAFWPLEGLKRYGFSVLALLPQIN